MKIRQSIHQAILLLVSLLTISTACSAQDKEKKGGSQSKILHIDANYMRDNIYDFEAHPDTFVYKGTKPAIIDFYADWCGPCRRVAPILKELAAEYKDDIVIYKVDVVKEQELASAFGINSLPTLLFVPRQGKPQASMGLQPKETLAKYIDEFLLEKKN